MPTTKRRTPVCCESSFLVAANQVWLSVGIAVTMTLAGCNQDYSTPLPSGYRIARANASSITVNGPDRVIGQRGTIEVLSECYAGPIVDGLDVIGSVIAGHARLGSPPLPQVGCQFPGYFLIATSTQEHWLELTKQEYDARCKVLGIVPNLKPPSHFK